MMVDVILMVQIAVGVLVVVILEARESGVEDVGDDGRKESDDSCSSDGSDSYSGIDDDFLVAGDDNAESRISGSGKVLVM
ncbi:hypothetical protein E2C01_031848 [Portunus trituberculatus]|uniref:Uncharacterized protein n=1 Tax=Portunus trituberculatus TaxID=210409 RepID=A0A5B7EVU6_PORTR|nr:hypothetical protein [Portunus trituberculatus]